VENAEIQLVRPPVSVRVHAGSARHRALGLVIHLAILSLFAMFHPVSWVQCTQRISSGKVEFCDYLDKIF
jgi:hypothetical protein